MTTTDHVAGGFDAHPGEALSGLLDGELDARAAEAVRAHVRDCAGCAEELHWARAVRWSLRSLPPVEPPSGFLDLAVARQRRDDLDDRRTADRRIDDRRTTAREEGATVVPLAPRRRPGPGVAPVGASVAAGIALFALSVFGAQPGPYLPAVDAAVGHHESSLATLSAGGLRGIDGGTDPLQGGRSAAPFIAAAVDPQDLPAPFRVPARLDGGYRLVETFASPGGLQLVYRHGRYGLSVFEAPGRLDVADLPPESRSIDVAGVTGWRWEGAEIAGRVVIFERDGLVVTVIGDEPGDAVTDAARSVPEPRPLSLAQQVGAAGVGIFEALSP